MYYCRRYEFLGGPLDGEVLMERRLDPYPDDVIYEWFHEGTFLYQSNGPIGQLDNVVILDYTGKETPTDAPGFCLLS